jgi:hypothetical protein
MFMVVNGTFEDIVNLVPETQARKTVYYKKRTNE